MPYVILDDGCRIIGMLRAPGQIRDMLMLPRPLLHFKLPATCLGSPTMTCFIHDLLHHWWEFLRPCVAEPYLAPQRGVRKESLISDGCIARRVSRAVLIVADFAL